MKFRKKPVVIEAIEFTGDNAKSLCEWIAGKTLENCFQLDPMEHLGGPHIKQVLPDAAKDECIHVVVIPTLEGAMEAFPGDWIICGVKGEYYPCKPDIFSATYEAV